MYRLNSHTAPAPVTPRDRSPPPSGTVPSGRIRRSQVWTEGLRVGLRTVLTARALGLKRLLLPVSYWRLAEFTYVWNHLDVHPGDRILDVGSPKTLACMLAGSHDVEVVATDIQPGPVRLARRYMDAQQRSGAGTGRVRSEVQDGRSLGYADDVFDAAYTVSVLEHIPGEGDRAAMRELVRVVRPGGHIVVTVPYDGTYREEWVDGAVYEREQEGDDPVFYQRHYDDDALRDRLLEASGVDVLEFELWGERHVHAERWLERLRWGRSLLSPLEPLLSILCLQPCGESADSRAMAAFLTIQV